VDKAAVATVGLFIAFGFTVLTAGYGAAKQKELKNNLWQQVDRMVVMRGGRRIM